MKHIISSLMAFKLTVTFISCSDTAKTTTTTVEMTTTTALTTTTPSTTVTTTPKKTTTVSVTTEETTSDTSGTTVSLPDYDAVEQSLVAQLGDPDYNVTEAAIPYVAWTEVNLDKTMYANTRCIGYEFALSDAKAKLVFDAGIALHVIARTSTDYYRIENDYYIPCEFLDNAPVSGIDPSTVTSSAVTEATTAVTVSETSVTTS